MSGRSRSRALGDKLADLGTAWIPLKGPMLYQGARYARTSDVATNQKAVLACLSIDAKFSVGCLTSAFKIACDRLRCYEKSPEAMAHVMVKLLHKVRWKLRLHCRWYLLLREFCVFVFLLEVS